MSFKGRSILCGNLVLLLLGMVVFAGCSSSQEETSAEAASPYPNVDLANTRSATTSISAENVSDLKEGWSQSLSGEDQGSGFLGSPVVAGEVVFLQSSNSNVRAMDLASGKTLWETRFDLPARGPNGLAVAQGMVFGGTPTNAFGLDADSGKKIWSVRLVRNGGEKIAMAPGYHDGVVYISTAPAEFKGDEVGVLWALDARTGKKIWHFDTVPRGLWGDPRVNFGGGLSHAPAFDGEGGMYVGTGNAGPAPGTKRQPWGSSRPGPNLYTASVVKLDEKTGKVKWHYQLTPHGLCNWDVNAPVLTEVDGRRLVIAAGQAGVVVALDQETGELVWRRPVGKHNGHDNDGLVAMRGEYDKLKTPMTVYPGVFGGVTGSLAVNESTVFVPVVNVGTALTSQESAALVPGTTGGELVALNLATGEVNWKAPLVNQLFSPILATNDLVFAATIEGLVWAFDPESGEELWSEQIASYIEGGLAATGDTLLVREKATEADQAPRLLAYRLSG